MITLEFIQNIGGIEEIISLSVIGLIAFFWIWTILWITKDITARTNNWFIQTLSILIGVIPIFGFFLYILVRPIGYKFDRIPWRESIVLNSILCPDCGNHNLNEFKHCIHCGEKLKIECKECKTLFSSKWEFCPNCAAPNLNDTNKV